MAQQDGSSGTPLECLNAKNAVSQQSRLSEKLQTYLRVGLTKCLGRLSSFLKVESVCFFTGLNLCLSMSFYRVDCIRLQKHLDYKTTRHKGVW